jgi:hypothetical protein
MEYIPDDPWRVSWEALSARAWQTLEFSSRVPPSVSHGRPFHGIPRLQFTDDPQGNSLEANPTTLTVFELFGEGMDRIPVVREAVWHRAADYNRGHEEYLHSGQYRTLLPTVVVRDGSVPLDRLSALLREGNELRLPVACLDNAESVSSGHWSTTFEFLSRHQPPARLRLQWSSDKPAEWEPALEWAGRLRQFLERCLAAKSG